MNEEKDVYVPALGHRWLTPLYDPVVRLTTRETEFKTALLRQADIRAGHRVLDLACGTATLTIAIKQAFSTVEVTGIDGDRDILERARSKAKQAKVEIQFNEGLSYELPYPEGHFDRVLSSLFFHHLSRENKLRTLAEVRRVLRPGGEIHIADWGLSHNWIMRVASYSVRFLDGADTTKDSFDGLLPDFMRKSGFGNVEETDQYNSLFGTIQLYKARKDK